MKYAFSPALVRVIIIYYCFSLFPTLTAIVDGLIYGENDLRRLKIKSIYYPTQIVSRRETTRILLLPNNNFSYQFDRDGYVVINNFLSEKQVEELKNAGRELTENVPDDSKTVFSTNKKNNVSYM